MLQLKKRKRKAGINPRERPWAKKKRIREYNIQLQLGKWF